jgi:hypothetical protein
MKGLLECVIFAGIDRLNSVPFHFFMKWFSDFSLALLFSYCYKFKGLNRMNLGDVNRIVSIFVNDRKKNFKPLKTWKKHNIG